MNKLISGVDQTERADLAAEAASQTSTTSSTSPISYHGISPLNDIKGSCLYQIPLPEGLERKSYGLLYKTLTRQGLIPLGLLRGTFSNMNMGPKANRMPYVYTNPDKNAELFICDRVFVLSPKPVAIPTPDSVQVAS
jgi:hypothetical protein